MGTPEQQPTAQRLRFSPELREVLVGVLLGDAHLETFNRGRTFRLKIEQSQQHAAYVDHLYEWFRPWTATPPRSKTRSTAGRTPTESRWFQTVGHGSFRFYAHQFYRAGKKVVPKLIHRWLTPRTLAYWFMDDGSMKSGQSKGVLFNTQAFDKPDVERLVTVLQTKLGLAASLRRQGKGWQVYVSGKSYETLRQLIEPFLIPNMRHKLPPTRRTRMPKE